MSSYSLIDDDHIDDQETINVGNLIIDLESDLEKEKFENEQANAKPIGNSTNNKDKDHSLSPAPTATPTSLTSNTNGQGPITNSRTAFFKSSSDERGELKMRITRETKPGKSEHKITTSPTSSCVGSQNSNSQNSGSLETNNNNSSNNSSKNNKPVISLSPAGSNKNPLLQQQQQSITTPSISSTKECGTSTSIGTITEPDCLGPCEPGTSVTLEGIVWQETEGGILVVNVTWRGKTYVGALLDCTKHDWAPPRLCDSPASDIDSKAHKGVRTKRIVTRSNGVGIDEKNLLQTTGKLRNGKGRRILPSNELAPSNKRQKESDKSIEASDPSSATNVASINDSETTDASANNDATPTPNNLPAPTSDNTNEAGPNSPILIGCGESNCSKKYRNLNGLLYHRAHAHGGDNDQNTSRDTNCSPCNTQDKNKSTKPDQIEPIPDAPARQADPIGSKVAEPILKHPNEEANSYQAHELPMAPNSKLGNNTIASAPLPQPQQQQAPPPPLPTLSQPPLKSPISEVQLRSAGINNHSSSMKSSSSGSKHNESGPIGAPSDEGMKPSGTSTGPPPAPHQANCYFNSAFLANAMNPYSYFNRPPMSMFDPANAAFLSRFMRPPAPESPSRLLSPSMAKNIPPFPQAGLPLPTSQMPPSSLPNVSPLVSHPPLATRSPHLRMPSQVDPLLPSPPTFPMGMNPSQMVMGMPPNPMGPMGGPQVPNLIDDPIAKQFQRRFN